MTSSTSLNPWRRYWAAIVARWRRRGTLGARGERAAATFLRCDGYRVIGRNLRTNVGELDLLCLAPDERTIVFVEVKTRRRAPDQPAKSAAATPEDAITRHKRGKLIAVTRGLVRANHWEARPWRIDVVAIEWRDGQRPQIRHHVDAVRGR